MAMSKRYLSCAETAKLVRQALKEAFPKTKFSVRSNNYSGGASIDVTWTDGPFTQAVESVAKRFEGATFDGMIDLKSYHSSYIGTEQGLEEVRFGADFVFCRRIHSETLTKRAEAYITFRQKIDPNFSDAPWQVCSRMTDTGLVVNMKR